jgi:hypothetical protein
MRNNKPPPWVRDLFCAHARVVIALAVVITVLGTVVIKLVNRM